MGRNSKEYDRNYYNQVTRTKKLAPPDSRRVQPVWCLRSGSVDWPLGAA